MRTLDRYVARQFLRIFGLTALGVPFVFIVTNLTEELDTFLARDVTAANVFLHYAFSFANQMLLGWPIAGLLAAVFTISRMGRHSEITAAKAAGISFYRLSAPIVIGGFLLSLVALGLTEIVPGSNRRAALALGEEFNQERPIRSSFVYRAEEGRVYKVRRLDAERGEISDLQVEREGAGFPYPTYNVAADKAHWDADLGHWIIETGRLRLLPDISSTITFRFRELHQRAFREDPMRLLAHATKPDEMGYAELGRYIEAHRRSGGNVTKLLVQRMMKIAFPFATFVIVIFGMPLAYSSKKGGATLSIGIALATTMLFLVLHKIAEAVGAADIISPLLAAWIPNALFLIAGLALMSRVRT